MILRRFTVSMKKQDWTAIVVELVVVVLGVFIGLQASNWNQDRETDQRAAVFTQHLIEDLREEAWGYQLMIEYNQQVRASCPTHLDYATIKDSLDDPCTLDVPSNKIRAAANALKAVPRLVPALQVRFADNQTALTDLQSANRPVLKSLRAIRDGKN